MSKKIRLGFLGIILGFEISLAYAQEIVVDLGMFATDPCSVPSNSPRSYMNNEYNPRRTRVTAKIFVDPSNDSSKSAAKACAEEARNELKNNTSASNIQLFGEIFQRYLQACTRKIDVQIRSVRSFLSTDSTCEQ